MNARDLDAYTRTVATALAHAFLMADTWMKPALLDAGASVLGARRRWLGPLAREILATYRSRPTDAPRELVAVIRSAPSFVSAIEVSVERQAAIRIIHHPTSPTEARIRVDQVSAELALASLANAHTASANPASAHTPSAHTVTRLDSLVDLAALLDLTQGELDWFADVRLWNRRARPGRLHHYRYEWRQRPGRTPRLLEVPGQRLRAIQRTVLDEVLSPIPLHPAAHGFVAARSAVTGAAVHTGAAVVINLDLTSFFARVTAGRIYGVLRQAGLPEAVAHTLVGLAVHAVPPHILSQMPPGGSPGERFALRKVLAVPHLPQGAATSPALANLAVRRLDSRLAGWADAAGGQYTRYADDLAFSGGPELARRADTAIRGITRIVEDEGHTINPRKTRVRAAIVRQVVTGVVVNKRTNTPRREFDQLRSVLHNAATQGPDSQNRGSHSDFRAHLLGRISWMESVNPSRGPRLRAAFARIEW
ncbi:reverse transcriptase (RNA-dependent DNA polymerase) [Glaciihabitans tibetensis]|uniref:RNA-directed DNA polymerase n=1 Tax=Glaciihabitans tibetensis TaxID=1266600 RepID=A0A2T0VEM4_9MICO|nr:reverse transcriptase family protein [Glaciihabitans tibetensis]PRY68628.1 reverse transcriptase (RNA-dependent DNA polymerase) [Glaciihabitans tibetensis]